MAFLDLDVPDFAPQLKGQDHEHAKAQGHTLYYKTVKAVATKVQAKKTRLIAGFQDF